MSNGKKINTPEKHTDKKQENNRFRRILAWIGIVVIVAMYVVTFVAALTSSPATNGLFMASLALTIIVPGAIYVFQWFYKVAKREREE